MVISTRGRGEGLCALRAPLSACAGSTALLSCFTSLLGAGSQEVDHVQMMADVSQDLEFRHESLVLASCGPLCVRSKEESGHRTMGLLPPRRLHFCPPCLSLLTRGCSINFPTFCKRPSRQTVWIPPTLLSQHPFVSQRGPEARCVVGVSHWPFPFGGPGCAQQCADSEKATSDRQRLPLGADTGETRTLQAGDSPTPSLSLFPFLGSHKRGRSVLGVR